MTPLPPSSPFSLDMQAFAKRLGALREELGASGQADLEHLKKIERWGRMATAIGYATAPLGPNPLSIAALSLGRFARWTMAAHHVIHKGYDKVPDVPKRYTSQGFAKGRRRFVDWFDWIDPEAWQHEHNVLHHFRLGEEADPDLVERNLSWLREKSWPDPLKKALVWTLASVWKPAYYAPNTLLELHHAKRRRGGSVSLGASRFFDPRTELSRDLFMRCWLPYASWHFAAVPAMYWPLGPVAVFNVFLNSILAEFMTNLHTFVVITTNHAGDDLWRFDTKVGSKAEFQFRQVLGSVNFDTGGDVNDFLHGWLNYQIEHHVWPDLSMLQYQRIQPHLKALCQEFGVPYAQESVFKRLRKTLDIMTGGETMKAV
jgi:fatty acid desaturase